MCRCVTEEVQLIEGAVDAMCLFRSVGQSLVFCIGWDGFEVKERKLPAVVGIRFDSISLLSSDQT